MLNEYRECSYPVYVFLHRQLLVASAILKKMSNRHILTYFNTLRPRQNGHRFACDVFKYTFLNENAWILVQISLKFVPQGPINNIPGLVRIMVWRRSAIIWTNDGKKLTSIFEYEEQQFYQRQIIENKGNLRKVWAVIREAINRNKNRRISDQFLINEKTETGPITIAKGFQ